MKNKWLLILAVFFISLSVIKAQEKTFPQIPVPKINIEKIFNTSLFNESSGILKNINIEKAKSFSIFNKIKIDDNLVKTEKITNKEFGLSKLGFKEKTGFNFNFNSFFNPKTKTLEKMTNKSKKFSVEKNFLEHLLK